MKEFVVVVGTVVGDVVVESADVVVAMVGVVVA